MAAVKICTQCGKEITGQALLADGGQFHPDCFICNTCNKPISGPFNKKDGARICSGCIPQEKCAACGKAVAGAVLKAGGKSYHKECFTCASCHEALAGGFCMVEGEMCCPGCAQSRASGGGAPAKGPGVVKKCIKCKEVIEGEVIMGEGGDKFHEGCFVCYKCNGQLDSFVMDKAKRRNFEYAYMCGTCAQGLVEQEDVPERKCLMCKKACGEHDAVHLMDGNSLHWACFKCNTCQVPHDPHADGEKGIPLLRSKVQSLQNGDYTCDVCRDGKDDIGTYSGRSEKSREGSQITWAVRLMPRQSSGGALRFWLDKSEMSPMGMNSWHAEGKYVKDGRSLTLTVDHCPFGGGPSTGTVFAAELEEGSGAMMFEGVRCVHQEVTAAFTHEKPEGEPAAAGGPAAAEPAPAATAPAPAPTAVPNVAPAPAPVPAEPAVLSTKDAGGPPPEAAPVVGESLTLEQLQDPAECKAKGVDAAKKEFYLSDADFASHIGQSRADFDKQPKWKRDKKKKDLGIF